MKSALGWLIVLALIAGGAGFGLYNFHQTTREQAYSLALGTLNRNFVSNTSGLFTLDAETYRREIGPHLTRYFRDLNKLAKEFPEIYDIDREVKRGEAELERGRMTESQKRQRDERIDITRDLFERMRDGQYRPVYTRSNNNFRFDVYDISPAKISGDNQIKLSYVHWGPYPQDHRPGNGGPIEYGPLHGLIKLEQEKGKPARAAEIPSEGSQVPYLQIAPSRWISEFPTAIEIGQYNLPQMPRDAETLTLSFNYNIRTVGGSNVPVNIEFEEVPIPEAWKVPEGQTWKAQERFATDEELQAAGVMPTQNQ